VLLPIVFGVLSWLRYRRRRAALLAPPLLPRATADIQISDTRTFSSAASSQSHGSFPGYPQPYYPNPAVTGDARGPWTEQQPAMAGPSHPVSVPASRDVVSQNEKGEIVLRYEDPQETDAIRQLQQHAFAAITVPRRASVSNPPILSQEAQGAEDVRDQEVAALQGEIQRLRAALVVRTEDEVETPPAYQ
jgi:hypothetical protein